MTCRNDKRGVGPEWKYNSSRIHSIQRVPSVHGGSRIYFEHHVWTNIFCVCGAFILGPRFDKKPRRQEMTVKRKLSAFYLSQFSYTSDYLYSWFFMPSNHSQKRGVILGRVSWVLYMMFRVCMSAFCHTRRHVKLTRMYVHKVLYWESGVLKSISQSGINRLGSNYWGGFREFYI